MSTTLRSARARSIAIRAGAPFLAVFVLLMWALSSPVGSSPDDDFHLVSIWCGESDCAATDNPATYFAPTDLMADHASCYAYNAESSGQCQGRLDATGSSDEETSRGNFYGQYPPVFYEAMHLFARDDITAAANTMRVANSFLFVGMVTLLAFCLPLRHRLSMLTAVVITSVPLALFIVPSTNPSSWAVISSALVFFSVHGFYEARGRRRVLLSVVATIGTVMGAGARADSAAYAILAVIAATVLNIRISKKFLLSAVLPVVLLAISVAFYLMARQSEATSTGLAEYDAVPDVRDLFAGAIIGVPDLWAGVFGRWPLGWIDTPLPAVIWVASFAVFCAVGFAGIAQITWRKALVVIGGLAALWLVPTLLLVQSNAEVGELVQPRYLLPLIILFAGVILIRGEGTTLVLSRFQVAAAIGGLSLAQSIALHTNIRRYVTGSDVGGWNLDSAVEWWSNPFLSPMAVWLLGTGAFTVLLVLLGRYFWDQHAADGLPGRGRPAHPSGAAAL